MDNFFNYILQLKGILSVLIVGTVFVYSVKSGAIEQITGSWKKRYEAILGERDDALRKCSIQEEKIKDLEGYIRLLILNDKTRMEVELQQKHD